MDFSLDEEQLALQDAVRGLLAKAYGDFEQRRRATAADPGFAEGLWGRLAEMGVLGLPFPEEHGGMGAGAVEVGLVAGELGRVLAPEPYLTSVVLAGGLVSAVATPEQAGELLAPLADGTSLLAFAHQEPGRHWHIDARTTTATATGNGGGWRLDGVKEPVPAGVRADRLVVSARLPDGSTGLFVVAGDAPGLRRTGYRTPDGGRAARVSLDGVTASPLGAPGDRRGDVARAVDRARLAAFAEVVGGMDAALAATTAYLKNRTQFGVPLSTFQALRFRAADMYVALELTRSLVLWATMCLTEDAVARAGLQVSRAAHLVLEEAVQLHGGIGMTAEYAVGHHLTRLTVVESLFGTADHYLQRLASRVGSYADLDPLD